MAPRMATSAPAAPEPASAPSSLLPSLWPARPGSQAVGSHKRNVRSRASEDRAADWRTDERKGGRERSEHFWPPFAKRRQRRVGSRDRAIANTPFASVDKSRS